MANPYETDKMRNEYLLFHYGEAEEIMPWSFGPTDALRFPVRVVEAIRSDFGESTGGRALDLGCAVGRSAFELTRTFDEVLGIDYARSFIEAASTLAGEGRLGYERLEEGNHTDAREALVAPEIDRSRVKFEIGDAMYPDPGWGVFDLVLMANLLCRLPDPSACLKAMDGLVRPGGAVAITSPGTWLEEYTPREKWLGGKTDDGGWRGTLEGIRRHLEPTFELVETRDLPFLIREHRRKYQWSVAQYSFWRKR